MKIGEGTAYLGVRRSTTVVRTPRGWWVTVEAKAWDSHKHSTLTSTYIPDPEGLMKSEDFHFGDA